MDDDERRKQMEEEVGPWKGTTKKDAARRQILVAFKCLLEDEWECAITLAGAAEGQIREQENGNTPGLFKLMKGANFESRKKYKSERDYVAFVNGVRYWLKHNSDQKDRFIYQFDAVTMVMRAMSKYFGVYGDNLEELKAFDEWRTERGYSFKSTVPKGALRKLSNDNVPE
jgi:hypothetical protein